MMRRNPLLQTTDDPPDGERAVSEVLAFTLVFGIILTSVALLFGFGFQAVGDVQELEQTNNAERAMISVADNFNDVLRYDGVDERFSEVALRDGTIATGDDGTEVEIEYGGQNLLEELENDAANLGQFEYRGDSETISYDGGGVVRSGDTGDVMVKQPRMRYNENSQTATISLTEVDATSRTFQGSDGVGVRMSVEDDGDARIKEYDENGDDIDITITTENTRAWEQAAERGGWPDEWIEVDGDEVTIDSEGESGDVDRLVVHIVTVDLEIESGV